MDYAAYFQHHFAQDWVEAYCQLSNVEHKAREGFIGQFAGSPHYQVVLLASALPDGAASPCVTQIMHACDYYLVVAGQR